MGGNYIINPIGGHILLLLVLKYYVMLFCLTGAHVIMACRSIPRCKAAEKDILDLTGAAADSVNTVSLDLSSMESIRTFASEIKASE